MNLKCETKLCQARNQRHTKLIFKNTYGHEPTEQELEVFTEYLKSIKKEVKA